ncbi:MAG TPA: hypothetical protein VJJ70_07465, partial [Anaerolineales bacterium]|nr:hypothetical protein [Anaerolineales bacterium]
MPATKGSAATPKRATRAPAATGRKAAPRASGPAVRVSGAGGREAVIVAAVRTAVGRAGRGSLRSVRPDEM